MWLRHQRRDAQWKHGSVCENYADIRAAVYAVGGWADGYTNAIPRLLAGLKAPCRALIGPWTHSYPWKAVPGPAIDGLGDLVRWWDHWLKGIDTGMMQEPKLRAWMQESVPPATFYAHRPGRWVAEESWPSPRIAMQRYHLNADGLGAAAKREQALAHRSEVVAGITHGDWCPYGYEAEMPSDQREEDGRSLAFDTPPLKRRLEILGAPVLTLDVASDRPNALVYVRLCDVAPDGASTRVSFATLNLTHRNGHARPEPLTPGKRYRVRVQLNDAAHAFPAGHRIRVTIQTHSWPTVWPSPEDATLTVHTGASMVDLPVRPRRPEDSKLKSLGTPRMAPPMEITQWKPYHRARRMTRDYVTGETTVTMVKDRGHYRIEATGTELAGPGMETYTIRDGDPLSARAQVDHSIVLKRGSEWDTRLETRSVLTATRATFRISVHAQAWRGSERIWSKSWDDEIPRDGV
jgi:predicted acyl esterase